MHVVCVLILLALCANSISLMQQQQRPPQTSTSAARSSYTQSLLQMGDASSSCGSISVFSSWRRTTAVCFSSASLLLGQPLRLLAFEADPAPSSATTTTQIQSSSTPLKTPAPVVAVAAEEEDRTNLFALDDSSPLSLAPADPNSLKIQLEASKASMSPYSKLQTELKEYEMASVKQALDESRMVGTGPKSLMERLRKDLRTAARGGPVVTKKQLDVSREIVLTLKAYLDEAERDLFGKNWDNLQVYLYTFADQEEAFANLIDGLFPSTDSLDATAREAMSFEAQTMFLALDDLREAAKDGREKAAQNAYSKLLLSYDRFLKAGDLYPTYDPITSTAIFFANTPSSTLRFDAKAKVQVLDRVLLTSGPDMGKTATVINIDNSNAVIKLDKDGKAYQEVKYVKLAMLAKTLEGAAAAEGSVPGGAAAVPGGGASGRGKAI